MDDDVEDDNASDDGMSSVSSHDSMPVLVSDDESDDNDYWGHRYSSRRIDEFIKALGMEQESRNRCR